MNIGDTRWLALAAADPARAARLRAAFLDKTIVPGYVNDAPVARYRAYIETNRPAGHGDAWRAAVGSQRQNAFDLDYGRGFLAADVDPRAATETEMRLRAPRAPGLYCVTFDLVDEYLTWFQSRDHRSRSSICVSKATVCRRTAVRRGIFMPRWS